MIRATVIRTIFSLVGLALAIVPTPAAAALLLQYDFDEAVGPIALDTSLALPPANGTLTGAATRTTNTPGVLSPFAVDFTGEPAYAHVLAGDVDKVDGLGSFTLTTWLNLQADPTGSAKRLLAKQASSTFSGFNWSIHNATSTSGSLDASNFRMAMFIGGSTAFAFGYSDASTGADNEWRFLAVSYDGASGETKYYTGSPTDSVTQLGSTLTIGAGAVTANSALLGVGYTDAAPGSDTSVPGYQDDIRVYDNLLSLAELDTVRLAVVPEPSALVLLASGAIALWAGWRKGSR